MSDARGSFDRVPPRASRESRDREGKEALYSTAPTAPSSALVTLTCSKCHAESGLRVRGVTRLLRRVAVVNPIQPRRVWASCPSCGKRAWLEVSAGESLRSLLGRPG